MKTLICVSIFACAVVFGSGTVYAAGSGHSRAGTGNSQTRSSSSSSSKGNAAKTAAAESLKGVISSNMSEEGAGVLNAAIDAYVNADTPSAKLVAQAAVNKAIDTYIQNDTAKTALNSAVKVVSSGGKPDVAELGKTVATDVAQQAIDQIPGLSDEAKASAKDAIGKVISGEKSVSDTVKDNAGAAAAEALKAAGVKAETAQAVGDGITSVIKNGDPTKLVNAGVGAAIDQLPISDEAKAKAKEVTEQLTSGEKSIKDVAKDNAGKVAEAALKEAGVNADTAKAVGEGVDAAIKDGDPSKLINAGVDAAIDQLPISDDAKSKAKEVAEQLTSGEKSIKDVAKDNAGAIAEHALKEAGVSDEIAKKVGEGVDAAIKDGDPAKLVNAGVDIAIDQLPISDDAKATAKEVAEQLTSGEKSIKDVAKDNAGKVAEAALKEAGVNADTAKAVGEGVDAAIKDGDPSKLINAGVDAAIDQLPISDDAKAKAKEVAEQLTSGEKSIKDVAKDNAGAIAEHALKEAGVSDEIAKKVGEGVDAAIKDGDPAKLVNAGVDIAIDQLPISDDAKATAKEVAEQLTSGEKSIKDVAKDNAGAIAEAALKEAGVSEETAKAVGEGVDAAIKDGDPSKLINAGVDAAIDQLPISDDAKAKAKEVAEQLTSGEKSIKDVAKDNAGAIAEYALKEAGVSDETAKKVGEGVDAAIKDGDVSKLVNAGVDAAIDQLPISDEAKDAAKKAAADLISGDKSLVDVAKDSAGAVVEEALKKAGVDADTAKSIGDGISEFVKEGSTDGLVKAGVDAAIDNIPGLTDEQREAAKKEVNALISGEKSLEDIAKDGGQELIAKALEKAGIDSDKAKDAAGKIVDSASKFISGDKSIGELGGDLLEQGKDLLLGEDGLVEGWIDELDISDEAKNLAKGAVGAIREGDIGVLVDAGGEAVSGLLQEAGLSKEDADKIAGVITEKAKQLINGDISFGDLFDIDVDNLMNKAETIFFSKVGEFVNDQIDKLMEKYPIVGEVLNALGIDVNDIKNFFKNLSWDSIKSAFEKLQNMTLEDWKNLAKELGKKLLEWALNKAVDFINGKIEEGINKLLEKAMAALGDIPGLDKYMGLIQLAGAAVTDYATGQAKDLVGQGASKVKSLFGISSDSGSGGGSGSGGKSGGGSGGGSGSGKSKIAK